MSSSRTAPRPAKKWAKSSVSRGGPPGTANGEDRDVILSAPNWAVKYWVRAAIGSHCTLTSKASDRLARTPRR